MQSRKHGYGKRLLEPESKDLAATAGRHWPPCQDDGTGSTAPFMGSPRHPGQFRSRDNLRAITQFGRAHQPTLAILGHSRPQVALIFISMGGRLPTRWFRSFIPVARRSPARPLVGTDPC